MGETRARRWLDRHGAVDRNCTPLLVARLAARRRGERWSMVLIMAAVAAYLGVVAVSGASRGGPGALFRVAVFYAVLALGAMLGLWVQGRADRGTGRALRRRVAHPAAVRVGAVVGPWCLVAAALVVGAGVIAGLIAAVGATDPGDRVLGFILLGAVGVFALIALAGLAQVVRRPAIADDEQSLVDDLLLRREDALRVVVPYPALLAVIAAVQSQSLPVLFGFLGYAVVAVAAWSIANWATTHAATAQPAVRASRATA